MNIEEIVVNDNGSLKVVGPNIVIKDSEGKEFDLGGRDTISLCRCGQSANKPFCDGSHRAANFVSTEKARSLPPKN